MRIPLLVATSLLALAGCGGGGGGNNEGAAAEAGRPAPGAGQQPVNFTATTPDGRAEVRSGAAAAWPAGIPPYPGADTSQSVSVSGGAPGQAGQIFGFRTGDTPQQVVAFYVQAIGRDGYTIANQMDMGETATMTARRGQSEAVNVTATRTGGATQVQIVAAAGR